MDETPMGRGALRAQLGPIVIVAGMVMVALALLGKGAHHPSVAEPPGPSVTVTTTPHPSKSTRHAPGGTRPTQRTKTRPSSGRSRASDGSPIAAAGAPKTSAAGGRATSHRTGATAPSGSAPHPPSAVAPPVAEAPASKSCDVGLSLLALKACLSLGK